MSSCATKTLRPNRVPSSSLILASELLVLVGAANQNLVIAFADRKVKTQAASLYGLGYKVVTGILWAGLLELGWRSKIIRDGADFP